MVRPEESDQGINLNNAQLDSSVNCSICLDLVSYGDGERSRAKLQCGHEFHLDCIGSAFNTKGAMQCPNCRQIEKGRWLYASGPTNSPELSMDDWIIDDYPLFFGFEMPYRVHICPFRGLTHVHPSFESSVGMMSTLAPMITHQHPMGSPHPQGWVQYQQAAPLPPYHHHQQSSGLAPMPINAGVGRFDTARSLPSRFVQPGRVYDPNVGFSPYPESPSMNYLHGWGRENIPPHFP